MKKILCSKQLQNKLEEYLGIQIATLNSLKFNQNKLKLCRRVSIILSNILLED